ncbi:hypothetical protein DICVIV_06203 [Dictyocaulus viviparus]|uniref:Uncharacterized protein n=1 Tax=Dictyocaulus viviparus TaxID=29172 RepID=A0A0D8XZI3_DICVI|nr:hypothetical protein DICVIV_06203 [Dictyocaulus viviparus]
MVCVPCIFLPILLAIYLYFIQPLVLRFLPQRWVSALDSILYPTCPAKPPTNANEAHSSNSASLDCDGSQSSKEGKKDN